LTEDASPEFADNELNLAIANRSPVRCMFSITSGHSS